MIVQPHSTALPVNGHVDPSVPSFRAIDMQSGAEETASPNSAATALERLVVSGSSFRLRDIDARAIGWACRLLPQDVELRVVACAADSAAPAAGDVALVRIASLGYHKKLFTATEGQLRLYRHDMVIGVFGNRYATSAFEGRVEGAGPLHMLTNAGMIGTVMSRHCSMSGPTKLELAGYLADARNRRLNIPQLMAERRQVVRKGAGAPPVVLVVGTSMDSGKTTCTALLARRLSERGVKVSACKLTGSVSPRDVSEFRATGAVDVRDFSDYGLPSTSGVGTGELIDLFDRMTADAAAAGAKMILVEVADGLLQPENVALLADRRLMTRTAGTLLAAACPGSAIFGIERLRRMGHRVLAACGTFTSSPLYVREFEANCDAPALSTASDAAELADHIENALREYAPGGHAR